jgi:hypothetical protein
MNTKRFLLVVLVISGLLFAGCQKDYTLTPVDVNVDVDQTTSVETDDDVATSDSEGSEDTAKKFNAGELGETNELALGTLLLEDTGDAISPDQAASLLPLWQVVQSGSLQSQAETDAVLNQIKAMMTDSQLNTIQSLELKQEDMAAWMDEQGIAMAGPGTGGATEDTGPQGQMGGDMTDEERAAMREQMQNMTEEERAEMREEMGGQMPERTAGGIRGGNVLVVKLVELLNERAAV